MSSTSAAAAAPAAAVGPLNDPDPDPAPDPDGRVGSGSVEAAGGEVAGPVPATTAPAPDAALVAAVEAELADLECRRYTDPRSIDARARDLLEQLRSRAEMGPQRARARLVLADRASRADDVTGAVEIARAILLRARAAGELVVAARSEAVIAWCLFRMGAIGDAIAHAVEAVGLLPAGAPAHLLVDHRMILVLLNTHLSRDASAVRVFEGVLADAERLPDDHLLLAVLNNYAWTLWTHDRARAALPLIARLQSIAIDTGTPLNSTMLDTVASVLLDTGDLAGAETVARQSIDPATVEAEVRASPEALLTLARIRHRQGDPTEALELVLRAEAGAAQRNLPEITAMVTMEKSRLLAEVGDYRGAYEAVIASHSMWVQVRDRDALTGLWNRRHIDRILPVLLTDHQVSDRPLSVAILDIDHFKQINDQRSHLTGDSVLTRLGELLRDLLPEPGFTARLGGEEFLLVLPGVDAVGAHAACEAARALVEGQHWDFLTDGLAVTASIGHATSAPTATVSRLLGGADDALYEAKHAGRNRVRPAPEEWVAPGEATHDH